MSPHTLQTGKVMARAKQFEVSVFKLGTVRNYTRLKDIRSTLGQLMHSRCGGSLTYDDGGQDMTLSFVAHKDGNKVSLEGKGNKIEPYWLIEKGGKLYIEEIR